MRILATALVAVIVSASVALANSYTLPFSSYIAFGDSLSDDGKFGELSPPSFGGRFSNGIVYAEYIEGDFNRAGKVAFNFALGGATAGSVNTTSYPAGVGAAFGTFDAQINTFAATVPSPVVGGRPLFSVLLGSNDIFQNLASGAIAFEAADAVEAGIRQIGSLDPNYRDFVVMNLPDSGPTPAFAGSPAAALATAQVNAFNAAIAVNVEELRSDGFNIITFDLNSLSADLLANAGALGISITDTPCTPSLTTFNPIQNCAVTSLDPFTSDRKLADDFFFVDGVHPNRIVQAETAQGFRAAVSAAVVPLPAGLPLLLAGVAFFGLIRVRRAV